MDLDPSREGAVYYAVPQSGEILLQVQWEKVPPWSHDKITETYSFTLTLFASGAILFSYPEKVKVSLAKDEVLVGLRGPEEAPGIFPNIEPTPCFWRRVWCRVLSRAHSSMHYADLRTTGRGAPNFAELRANLHRPFGSLAWRPCALCAQNDAW